MILIGAFWMAPGGPVMADVSDYEFQLVQDEAKKGVGVQIAVRLVDKRTGETVPGAVISATRIDMAPDNMAAMEVPLEALPVNEPGVARFQANLMMAGRWQLTLKATVPGKAGTVEGKPVLTVLP